MSETVQAAELFTAFTSFGTPNFIAGKCRGCGAEIWGKAERCMQCEDARERSATSGRRLEASIPPSFRWSRFDAPELRTRIKLATAIAQAENAATAPRVLLVGPAGTGKTSLAIAMLRAWFTKHRLPALFVPCMRLGGARQRHALGDGEAPLVEEAIKAPLVVLDDLGAELNAPREISDVIHERHAEGLATWVTTGLNAAALLSKYGDGISRRIREGAIVINMQVGHG